MKKTLLLTFTIFLVFFTGTCFAQPFYNIATSVSGGTATVATLPATQAEELDIVSVTISDIEIGKQFLSIEVIATDLSIITTTEVSAGIEYSFIMPAQDVSVNIALEDIPAVTYPIAINVTGGTATVITNPLTEAEETDLVTVSISNIEVGKQFSSIEVIAADLSVIPTIEISAGVEYTFVMPAQSVTVNVILEDIPAVTYPIAINVTGGTATVITNPLTEAEEAVTVSILISDIEAGKQFSAIEVIAADLSTIPTNEVSAEIEYSFVMPAQSVTINLSLEDILLDPIVINTQPTSQTICEYQTANLEVDAIANNGETLMYQWYYNSEILDGETNSTLNTQMPGQYYCILTAGTDELTSDNITVTVVEVNPVLEAEIEACNGTNVQLDPGVFSSYEWQDLSTDQMYQVTSDGTYSVIVTGDNGCTASASSIVTFFSEVEIAFEDTVNLCAGSSLTLIAPLSDSYEWGEGEDTQEIEVTEEGWYYLTVTIATCTGNDSTYVQATDIPEAFDLGDDIYTCAASYTITGPEVTEMEYLWSTTETTQSIEVTETGTYTLTLLNESGCGVSDEIMIEFGTTFEFSLYEVDTIESCNGNTVILETEIGTAWSWSTGDETMSIEVTDADWYYLTVTAEGGCIGNDSVYVHFFELPAVNIGEDLEFCNGLNAELTAPESVSYLWNTGETTQSITIDTAGTYICTITDENACSNSDAMTLSILPSPNVDLGEDMIVDEDQVLVFGTQQGHPEYLWSTGATTDFILVNASDLEMGINTISVTVTGNNGCFTSDEVVITVIPGASVETENISKYNVYPNPSNGIINIEGENIININIFDSLGREILNTDEKQIDISNLSNGVYTIIIVSDNQKHTSKLIKQ